MRCSSLTVALVAVAAGTLSAQGPKRPMTVDDIFTLEAVTTVRLSPNGQSVAAVIQRVQSDKEIYSRDYMFGDERADIWLVPRRGGDARNLTNGIKDKSGYFGPVWSPDGKRIAMLSTKGGDNIRLFAWDQSSGALTKLTERGMDQSATIALADGRSGAFVWLDAERILAAVLPQGEASSRLMAIIRTSRVAPAAWAKSERGEVAVSVLETGPDVTPTRKETELQIIDVGRGSSRVVGRLPLGPGSRAIKVAPDGRTAAVLVAAGTVTMDTKHRLGRNRQSRLRLGLVTLDGSTPIRWIEGAHYTSLGAWASDGSTIAVMGKLDEWDDTPPNEAFLVDRQGTAKRVTPDGQTTSALVWTADARPVLLAKPKAPDRPVAGPAGRDSAPRTTWLRVDETGVVDVTRDIKTPPTSLSPTREPNVYLGISGGDLWKVDVAAGTATNLTAALDPKVTSLVAWDHETASRSTAVPVEAETSSGAKELYRVPIGQPGTPQRIQQPSPLAKLQVFAPDRSTELFAEEGPTGSFVWAGGDASSSFTRLLARNEHLATIADPKRMMIDYRGIDGDSLKGYVVLPPDYEPGKRYPVVVWVYAGSVKRDTTGSLTDKNDPHPLNLLPLVSRGYVLLQPSMPLDPEGVASDPYIELPKGVLTAVDKLVEVGIADPNRLAVMGQSFGGFSTYSLVTYTTRFKAAVSMAGLSNLVSFYGQFDLRDRYTDTPHENLFYTMLSEGGQIRMGAAPWENLWRYLRNSPLLFVDRVETPLLIVGADQDYVTITQGEEFFTALHRQGKRAKFLRYWGDEHVIGSPGNVRHMWGEIFDWFDRFLKPEAKAKADR